MVIQTLIRIAATCRQCVLFWDQKLELEKCPKCGAPPQHWAIQLDVPIIVPFAYWDGNYPAHNEPQMRAVDIYNAFDNRILVCALCDHVLGQFG